MENYKLYSPFKYMDEKRHEFTMNLNDHGYDDAKTEALFKIIVETIKQLEINRVSRRLTEDILRSQKHNLNNPPEWQFVAYWIEQAIKNNDTYKYANNIFTIQQNNENHTRIPINELTEFELLNLIESQTKSFEESYPPDKITASPLKTDYSIDKLISISARLKTKQLINSKDESAFLAIFSDKPVSKVFWNMNIRGAQNGLFDLLKRLTGINFQATDVKKYFVSTNPIHDKWNANKPGKLIDVILKDI